MAAVLRDLRPLAKLGAKVFRSNTFACFSFHNSQRPVYSIGYNARQQELPRKLLFRTLCNERDQEVVTKFSFYGGPIVRLMFWYLKLMVDPSLDREEIAEGGLQALRFFHELMRERDFQSMEGIVSRDFIAELQNSQGRHELFKFAAEASEEQYYGVSFHDFRIPKKDTISVKIATAGVPKTLMQGDDLRISGAEIAAIMKTKFHFINLEKEMTKDKSGQWQIKRVSSERIGRRGQGSI